MNVMVTGSEGFLGLALCSLIDNSDRYNLIRYDILLGQDVLDFEQLNDALSNVDVCIHLAAVADLYEAEKDPLRTKQLNVEATGRMLELCNLHGVRLLFASTVCAYGNNGCDVSNEEAPLAPTEVYASSKAEAESFFSEQLDKHCLLRLATFYGPNMRSSLATSIFLKALLDDETIFVHGDGLQTRCFTHVDDVARGIICILDSGQNGIFNISSEVEVSVLGLIETLALITGKTPNIEFIEDRFGQIKRSNISSNRLKNLGWAPIHTLESGLRSCLKASGS